jgi:hypothetical protein
VRIDRNKKMRRVNFCAQKMFCVLTADKNLFQADGPLRWQHTDLLQTVCAGSRRVKQVRKNRPAPSRGRHFEDGVIILCVRWYLRYSLSYRVACQRRRCRPGRIHPWAVRHCGVTIADTSRFDFSRDSYLQHIRRMSADNHGAQHSPSIRVWLTKKEVAAEVLGVRQTSPVLRSIVLITESIFPLHTCLARLRVKPVNAWKGRCDGSDSA